MKFLIICLSLLATAPAFAGTCEENLEGTYQCEGKTPGSKDFVKTIEDLWFGRISMQKNEEEPVTYSITEDSDEQITATCTKPNELLISNQIGAVQMKKPQYITINNIEFDIGKIENISSKYKKVSNDRLEIWVSYNGITTGVYHCHKID